MLSFLHTNEMTEILWHRITETACCLLQVENLLLSNEGYIRLCDFGSATTSSYYPDHSWTAIQRSTVEDEASIRLPTVLSVLLNFTHLCRV